MKRWIFLCFTLFVLNLSFAQNMDDKTRFKNLSGNYTRSSDGICLFDDGTFLLYGYATAVFGKYSFEKELLKFKPDKLPLFEVYATANNALKDSARINFKGFDRNRGAFLQFGSALTTGIFNKDANCFDAPFVYQTKKWSGKTILSSYLNEYDYKGEGNFSLEYQFPENLNDFIFVYNAPTRYSQEFVAVVDSAVLKTSEYGGESGFRKKALEDNGRDLNEILEWKKQYDLEKSKPEDIVYANKHYSVFPAPENNYKFDKTSGQYIQKNADENEVYHLQNQYNDDRYLRKYVKVDPVDTKDFNPTHVKLAPTTIFYTVCGEASEKSYHYNGYLPIPETKEIQQTNMLQPIPNVVIEGPSYKFYFLKFSASSKEVEFPKSPIFSQSDVIEASKVEDDKQNFTLVLKLNAKAIKNVLSLENGLKDKLLMKLSGKQIKTSTFKVIADTVQLTAGFTSAEIDEIFKQLAK